MVSGQWTIQPPPRRSAVWLMMIVTALACTAAISQVWTRLQAIDYGYKISKASKKNAKLMEVNRRLRLEVALLKNPARIARIATEKFDLHPPQPEQIRRLRLRGSFPPSRSSKGPVVARAVP